MLQESIILKRGLLMKKKCYGLMLCAALAGCASSGKVSEPRRITVASAEEALKELKEGNEEFLSGNTAELRIDLAENGQTPYAVVITCSDSRVAPEVLFHTTVGELFTIRTAGNVVNEFEIGSAEYGVEHLGVPLIVVMGHSNCGAVNAAVSGEAEGFIQNIIDEITPSVEEAKKIETEERAICTLAENLNIQNTIRKLRTSEILSHLEAEGRVKIIGAKYDIKDGKVEFLE
ncbi:MAG: carbonic anhydrase [Lachnospiraceae bacterium]|nr:carbonic anhydrase [Lachnospiraceae bacterium]